MNPIELAKLKKENEAYLKSVEWANILVEAEKAENKSFTVIYREPNGELNEAWHWLSEQNFQSIKEKYAAKKQEIVRFVEKTMPFGEYLKTIKGSSNDAN